MNFENLDCDSLNYEKFIYYLYENYEDCSGISPDNDNSLSPYYYFYAQNRYTDEKDRELNKNWFKHEYYTANSNNIDKL